GALGGVVGGIIGAAGAALAVYLTLAGQRREDQKQIHNAVVREVIEFSSMALGKLDLFENVRSGSVQIPKTKLEEMVKFPEPIVYSAISDKIGLLMSPQRIVGFYMKIISVRYNASIIARSPYSVDQNLDEDDIRIVVEPLAVACQLAKLIIEDTDDGA